MNRKLKIVNEELPKGFEKHWDNFNEEIYKKYLKAKEDWRLNKLKKQN